MKSDLQAILDGPAPGEFRVAVHPGRGAAGSERLPYADWNFVASRQGHSLRALGKQIGDCGGEGRAPAESYIRQYVSFSPTHLRKDVGDDQTWCTVRWQHESRRRGVAVPIEEIA